MMALFKIKRGRNHIFPVSKERLVLIIILLLESWAALERTMLRIQGPLKLQILGFRV